MNETREDELKPCPLCGMAAVEATYKTLTGADYMVGCNRPCSVTTFGVDRATARRLWNSRPGETAAVLAERERCASKTVMGDQTIRLHMGEMTAQEMRSVKAALKLVAALIREGK